MGHDMIAYWPSAKITCPVEDMEEVDEWSWALLP
jgi:hypothetical protein